MMDEPCQVAFYGKNLTLSGGTSEGEFELDRDCTGQCQRAQVHDVSWLTLEARAMMVEWSI